jgi:proline iminopeptidase
MLRPLLLALACSCCFGARTFRPATGLPHDATATSDGLALALRVWGPDDAAVTFIVVGGGPGLSHHYLEPLSILSAGGRRVVFYDQRGNGRSAAPPAGADGKPDPAQHTLEHHVADLDAVRASLGAARVHLVAHSWGSLIAQAYAIAHPERVASLIVLDGIPPTVKSFEQGADKLGERIEALAARGVIVPAQPGPHRDGDCSRLFSILPAYYADPARKPGPAFAGEVCHPLFAATLTPLAAAGFDLRPGLARLQIPTLVVMGAADPFGTEWADELAHAVPGAREVILPACGHFPWEECPAPFWSALNAFLPE